MALDLIEAVWEKSTGFRNKLTEIWGMDKRSLALFRVGLALVTLGDLYDRYTELYAHYSDWGILNRFFIPFDTVDDLKRARAMDLFWNNYWFCLHMMGGSAFLQLILVILQLICTLCLLVGYRTKLNLFFVWIFVASFQSRNFLVGHGGDIVHRMYIFWAFFFPIEEYYSVDAALKPSHNPFIAPKKKKQHMVLTGGTIAIIIQFCLLYIFSYLHKTGENWTTTHLATYYALNLDYFRTPIGDFFLNFPELLKFLTWAVLWWEGYGYLFFFIPYKNHYFKTFGVLGFFAMHMGFQACMRLSIFGWICAFGVLCLLPSWFWDSIVFPYLRRPERIQFKLFVSSKCKFCLDFVRIVKTFFLLPETTILPLEEEQDSRDEENYGKQYAFADKPSKPAFDKYSWLVAKESNGNISYNFQAIQVICKVSPLLWPLYPLLKIQMISKLGDKLTLLHNHKTISPPKPFKRRATTWKSIFKIFRKLSMSIFALFLIWICFTWNMANVGSETYAPPHGVRWIGFFFRLDQMWGMFSPHPPTSQWWYIFEGTLRNGTGVEIFKNEGLYNWEATSPVTFDKPEALYKSIRSHRWLKLFEQMNGHQYHSEVRSMVAQYVCREWNKRYYGEAQLQHLKIWFLSEQTELDGKRLFLGKQIMWEHNC